MRRFFSLILVFVLVFAVLSCNSKKKNKEKPAFEEQVTQEVSAEEGGTVKNSDGSISIEIPGGALDSDTTITMTIYDAENYAGTEDQDVISKVVEFEPSGTIFKKPVIITMATGEAVENKIVTAAVYRDAEGKWSYSEHGVYALLLQGRDEAGDPIMQSAAGDPIMLNAAGDPIMQQAAGDPIMMSAAGDPIMLASAGDPIMTNAAGDPIMNSAAGDPIMMTTGHFTAYTFMAINPKDLPVEPSDDEPAETDDDEPAETDDDEPAAEDDDPQSDEDIVPEPEKVYSKAICTGLRTCANMHGEMPQLLNRAVETDQESDPFECPKKGADFYGQDAQYAIRRSCVPQDFERLPKAAVTADDEVFQEIKDKVTGLIWLYTGRSGSFDEMSGLCSGLTYDGRTWRLPTPKEFMTIVDSDAADSPAFRRLYFREFTSGMEEASSFWTSVPTLYFYNDGSIMRVDSEDGSNGVMCVSGEEYGKAGNYTSETVDGEEAIRDSSTDLLWQKTSVSDKNWKEALEYCENLTYAGYSDWRLPNKNELTTLLDYSKTEVLSSFPGMTANVFASSTPHLSSEGESGSVWSVSMKEGRIDYVLSDNETEEQEVEEGDETEDPEGSSKTLFSVRCVRSDLDDLPEDGIPECNAKIGYTPCRDSSNGILWSSKLSLGNSNYSWLDLAQNCRNLSTNGARKWRSPKIEELRTLFDHEKIKTGGTCRVKDGCLTLEECFDESECVDENETPLESKLRDYGILVSGDAVDNSDHTYEAAWAIHTPYGALSEFISGEAGDLVARCVFDESVNDQETPYKTEEGPDGSPALFWSSISEEVSWSDAALYCHDLVEGSSSNWRVPTEDEILRLAIGGCDPDEPCVPYTNGIYSPFGDVAKLWTSSLNDNYFTLYNFATGSTELLEDADSRAYVRCVRAKGEPETVAETGYYEDENTGLVWSELSESMATYDYEPVESYCNGLNDAAYSDKTDWRVPTVEELITLLANCEAYPGDTGSDSGRMCSNYSFEGYSVLGDMVTLISSTPNGHTYDSVDFLSGEIRTNYYLRGKVRCVAGEGALPVLPGE